MRRRARRRPFPFPSAQTDLQALLQAGDERLAQLGSIRIVGPVHAADASDGLLGARFASEGVGSSRRRRRFLALAEGDAARQRAIAVKAPGVALIGHLAALVHAVPGGPSRCHAVPVAVAAGAQAGVHVHGRVVAVIVLGVDGAGVGVGPGGEVLAAVQLVDRGGAAGGQAAARDHHVLRRVVDPLLLGQTGGWRRGQSAATVHAAVRVSGLARARARCHYQTSVLRCGRGQGGAGGAVAEGDQAGHGGVAAAGGHQAEGPSGGVGGCRRVGELAGGLEGNDLGGVGQGGVRDDGCGVGSVRGHHTCRTPVPVMSLRPPQLLGLGPGQRACSRGVSHVHHRFVKLKLPNRPLRGRLLLLLGGGAAKDGVGAEGHPGAVSRQTVEPGGVSVEVMWHHQDPGAFAAAHGNAACGGGRGDAGHLSSDPLSSLRSDPPHGWRYNLDLLRLAAGVSGQ